MTEDRLTPILERLAVSRYDEAGWEELYRELWPMVVATLYRRHGLSTVLADDLAQEVMIRLLKSAKFAGVTALQFRAYVNTTCRSVAVDFRRKMSRRGEEVPLTESLVRRCIIESANEAGQLMLQFRAEELPDFDRELLDKVLAGRRPNEIAQELHAPVGTVHVWLHRLRKRLRESLSRRL